jgi:hypothetical protein
VINIRAKVAVFYGKVDQKRDPGWYWTSFPGPGEPLKGTDHSKPKPEPSKMQIRQP